jgi:prolyl-tRNA synthetase
MAERHPYDIKIDAHGEVLGERLSGYLSPTLKEVPADAEVASHQLMIRAGLIRKLATGVFSWLPMGLRSLRKIERVIRAEMNRFKAREVLLPAVQPAEIWRESGRWERYGPELLRVKDRHDREMVVGPTHEEVVTDLARREIRSFRDMPLNLYQIQTKFRDEIRPRFGLMRGREFIMKDAYSFDVDEEAAEASYRDMYRAYENIFTACGLDYAVVEADGGSIGGSFSHEFMVLAQTGEDALVACPACGYAANLEKAELRGYPVEEAPEGPLTRVHTPACHDVPTLARHMGVPESAIVKSMLFTADGPDGPRHVLALIPGHRVINPVKLKNALGGYEAHLTDPETAEAVTGVPKGFVTPIGAKTRIIADRAVPDMKTSVVGAGEVDWHYSGARPGVDYRIDEVFDLAEAAAGDPCPRCGEPIVLKRGIEVGHVFKLGTKYSKAMGANYAKADGSEAPIVMGCYGIGLGRTLAAAIEQGHDADGIVWPMALAPFECVLLPLEVQSPEVAPVAEKLFDELTSLGVETLLDDRDLRPGPKFKDADLFGIPIKVTISRKSLARGQVEIKSRRTREVVLRSPGDAAAEIVRLKDEELARSGTGRTPTAP